MSPLDWITRLQAELDHAEAARNAGNEGMARVCARRAVGIAISEYLSRQGIQAAGQSAYDKIRLFSTLPHLPDHSREIAGHFLLRITPDHTLPLDIDLLAEARLMIHDLLGEEL